MQVVTPADQFQLPVEVVDVAGGVEEEVGIRVAGMLEQEAQRPFDLFKGPLLRLLLLILPKDAEEWEGGGSCGWAGVVLGWGWAGYMCGEAVGWGRGKEAVPGGARCWVPGGARWWAQVQACMRHACMLACGVWGYRGTRRGCLCKVWVTPHPLSPHCPLPCRHSLPSTHAFTLPSPPSCHCSLVMAVTIHHLVMDGWSYGVLTEELKTVRRWRERG